VCPNRILSGHLIQDWDNYGGIAPTLWKTCFSNFKIDRLKAILLREKEKSVKKKGKKGKEHPESSRKHNSRQQENNAKT